MNKNKKHVNFILDIKLFKIQINKMIMTYLVLKRIKTFLILLMKNIYQL